MKTLKKVPKFKNENDEREFWAKHDSSEFIDYSKAKSFEFPNLKPSTKTISIRLPEFLINKLKVIANKKDIPYQSLIKLYLAEKTEAELQKKK